jgi:diaminopimelate epimerase
MTVQTDAGLVYGRRIDETRYRVQLNNPGILDLYRKETAAYVELGCPGVPHGVVEVPGLMWEQREQLREMAKALRFDPAFPKGANINFYTWLGEDHIRILTYERGVEDYTLACGTGTASTACALFAAGKLPGRRLIADNPGGTLTVDIAETDGEISAVFLEGPTEVVEILNI